ncbi:MULTISPECIES: hypothetical protein [Kribbella]|uniref:hypothetical protein n=1 Tax=Kribbella TaxID=182639 RepID=UPI001044F91D|nr:MULTISPECIES: hypothetical protein [Kribbella]
MSDLGSRFIEAQDEPIELDGRLVHMSHLMTPLPAGVLKLWMRPTRDLEQGVGISADGGWAIPRSPSMPALAQVARPAMT